MKKPKPLKNMLPISDVSARLGPSVRAIQRWCEKGLLDHSKYPNGQIFIPLAEVERIERQSQRKRVEVALPESSRIEG